MQKQNLQKKIRTVCRVTVDALYPPACPVCGKPAPWRYGERQIMHEDCRRQLQKTETVCCMKCGKPLENEEREYCRDCSRTTHVFVQGTAAFAYTDAIKDSIYRFKYKNHREYAAVYGREIYRNCGDLLRLWAPQVIVPVPLHRSKCKSRGYNQTELVARELSFCSRIPMDPTLLVRQKKTTPMKELDDRERFRNLEHAFAAARSAAGYERILLLDDIYTTGATMDACSRELLNAGAGAVYCISLCIGQGF